MLFETTIEIEAPRETVWSTLADVERWHEWTASVTSIELLTKRAALRRRRGCGSNSRA